MQKYLALYDSINYSYKNYFKTENSKKAIAFFDENFPNANIISDIKKIDFLIWQIKV